MRPMRGIALKLGSVLVFITMSALIKLSADHVPPGEAVFVRAFFAMPVILSGWRCGANWPPACAPKTPTAICGAG